MRRDAFAETLQRHEYQPHRLTFGERLVIHFGINGDFYTGILLGGVVVSLVICADAATLICACEARLHERHLRQLLSL
jgi:hypothetical protein